jgi:hypothetical protein
MEIWMGMQDAEAPSAKQAMGVSNGPIIAVDDATRPKRHADVLTKKSGK